MPWDRKVPFDFKGNQMHYPSPQYSQGEKFYASWKDNYEFREILKFTKMRRGRSAAYFELEDSGGKIYTMFMTDVLDVLQKCDIVDGWVGNGNENGGYLWTFVKRGQNYGIKLVQ